LGSKNYVAVLLININKQTNPEVIADIQVTQHSVVYQPALALVISYAGMCSLGY